MYAARSGMEFELELYPFGQGRWSVGGGRGRKGRSECPSSSELKRRKKEEGKIK